MKAKTLRNIEKYLPNEIVPEMLQMFNIHYDSCEKIKSNINTGFLLLKAQYCTIEWWQSEAVWGHSPRDSHHGNGISIKPEIFRCELYWQEHFTESLNTVFVYILEEVKTSFLFKEVVSRSIKPSCRPL